MKKYKRKFNELSGKSTLKFNGEDQIGKFWVVEKARENSEMEDILWEADIFDMVLQIRGGLDVKYIIGIYTDKNKAKKMANIELKKRDK